MTESATHHVVAIPYPGRGHVNPMMNLCKLIALRRPSDFHITVIVTEEWLGFIEPEPRPPNIRFATIPNVIPSEVNRGADIPGFIKATQTKMKDPVEQLLKRIQVPISVLVYDTYLTWALDVGDRMNIPVASLFTMSATVFSMTYHYDLLVENHHVGDKFSGNIEEIVDYIPGVPPIRVADLVTIFNGKGIEVKQVAINAVLMAAKAQFLVFVTVYELEAQAIDALKSDLSLPVYAVGPAIPYFNLKDVQNNQNTPDYVQWLDRQPKGSVLYISQGSFLTVSDAQLDEIVAGVQDSGVRYMWVARGEASLSKSKNDGKGLFVPWCDQLRVLCHDSVGAFWSHCGWSSTKEGAFSGKPMITFPILWDQVTNSKMIVEDWKTGKRATINEAILVTREKISELGFTGLPPFPPIRPQSNNQPAPSFGSSTTMYHNDLPPLSEKMKEALLRCSTMDDDDSEIEDYYTHHNSSSSSVSTCSRFEDLNLSPELIKGLYAEMKFERACKIQSVCLPMILTPQPPYNNLLVRGSYFPTGKTTCLVLAMLTRLDPNLSAPQALCLCPSTKYAIQIMEVIRKMEKFTGITSELCPDSYITVSNRNRIAPLTAQVIIGSPDFVDMWIANNKLGTSNLKIVVFDDAYLTLGCREEDSVRIVKETVRWSPKCQVLVFSCFSVCNDDTVKAFVSTIVKDLFVQEFHQLTVDEEEPLSFDSVKQYAVNVVDDAPSKIRVIKDKIMGLGDGVRQTVIYAGTRESAQVLHEAFFKDGYAVTTTLSPLTLRSDDLRAKNKEFKDGLIQVLIACGGVSSLLGFDLSQVNLVINYDLPLEYGLYGAQPHHEAYLRCLSRAGQFDRKVSRRNGFHGPRPHHEAYLRCLGRAGQFGRNVALFNLICGDGDRMIMEKIVSHSNYHVTELPSPPSDDDFKDALKKAGLMGFGL
ncbi:hypothetical protein SSX86_013201 [Deinandra increscens subsp. villosa]|uniref:Uncharacterized protein n=1 Tax=Deinandra increscens subsp. villosa TaxID=3103831 RepID=A0AAP0D5L9_9ASTR